MVIEWFLLYLVGGKVWRFLGKPEAGVIERIGVGYLIFLALMFQFVVWAIWALPAILIVQAVNGR